MQSLDDDERREVLGEVMLDELKLIREYVEDIPLIKKRLDTIDDQLAKIGGRVNEHELDIRYLRRAAA